MRTLRLKKISTRLCAFTLAVCSLPFFSACKGTDIIDDYGFGTQIRIEVYDKKISRATREKISATFDSIEEELSNFSLRFNQNGAGAIDAYPVAVEITEKSLDLYRFTSGAFDPSVYPFVQLWGFDSKYPVKNFTPPSDEQIQALLKTRTDFAAVETNEKSIIKPSDEMQIDFGAIAKGYAADRVAKLLTDDGHSEGFISVGGSSLNLLSVSSLSIRHPEKPSETVITVNSDLCKNVSVSTSGGYERFYDYEGKRYTHVIDPASGYPTNSGVISATVICNDGAAADAFTTALCVLKKDEAVTLAKKISARYGATVFILTNDEDGKSIYTNLQKNDFTLKDASFDVITF